MTPATAAGRAQEHMLVVTETGCVFVEYARDRGDECTAMDWTVEVAHRTRGGVVARSPADLLISDAVLYYTAVDGGRRRLMAFFLKIDRATMSAARLARKIDHYARYYTHVPAPAATATLGATRSRRVRPYVSNEQDTYAWRRLYPVFPKLLVVLTGAPDQAPTARVADLRAWCLAN